MTVVKLEGGYKRSIEPPAFDLGNLPPSNLPLVEVIESGRGPWQATGKYGRQVEYRYPDSLEADPTAVFSIERQLGPPRARTLHFFRSDAQVAASIVPPVTNAGVYAKLTYGVGGIQNVALFDWNRGGQVSIVCDTLSVQAVAYAPTALAYVPPAGIEILGCMLGVEGSAPPRPPTFTTQEVALANGDTAVFPVPDFARWCFVCQVATTFNATDDVACFDFANVALKRLLVTQQVMALGFPIAGGTTEVHIRNLGPNAQGYLLQFELGL